MAEKKKSPWPLLDELWPPTKELAMPRQAQAAPDTSTTTVPPTVTDQIKRYLDFGVDWRKKRIEKALE